MIMNRTETIRWDNLWENSIREMATRTSVDYWEKRAADYTDMVRNSRFEHGEKICSFCHKQGIFSPDSQVLDIGSGPGALTIPFARSARQVTAIEPAFQMIQELERNARNENLMNITSIQSTWQNIDISGYEKRYDLVLCCHSLWHFPDILQQVKRMHQASRGCCVIAGGFGSDADTVDLYSRLGVSEPEFDQFHTLFNLFNQHDMPPNVEVIPYTTRRSKESILTAMELVVQKYHPVTEEDRSIISEYVLSRLVDDMYSGSGLMGLMWWKVGS